MSKTSLRLALTIGALLAAGQPLSAADSPSEPADSTLSSHLPAGVEVRRDLAYVTGGHERQTLDLYLPPAQGKTVRPVVVFVHGGGWLGGSKTDCQKPLAKFLNDGYVVASAGYRLSKHARFPAQIEDCKAAIRWLRAHAAEYQFDADRIGVMGPSAGGHLVSMLGTSGSTREFDVGENLQYSSAVQVVADYFGPTDFSQMQAHMLPTAAYRHDTPEGAEARLVGGTVTDPANREIVQRANPIRWLTKDAPPFIIFHGDKDNVVPYHQSELLEAALLEHHIPVHFYTVRGGWHSWLFPHDLLADIQLEFFNRYLKSAAGKADWKPVLRGEVPAEPEPAPKPAPAAKA